MSNGRHINLFFYDQPVSHDISFEGLLKSGDRFAGSETHFPFAKKCLEAGRHIVVDKPFTTTLAEARELVEIARRNDRVLTVYQERRCDGGERRRS